MGSALLRSAKPVPLAAGQKWVGRSKPRWIRTGQRQKPDQI